jgi:hypothetical protein
MNKDDFYSLACAGLCFIIGNFDKGWQPFWMSGSVILVVWTGASIVRRK